MRTDRVSHFTVRGLAVCAWAVFVMPLVDAKKPVDPHQGIYVGEVKAYDEKSLEDLLNNAVKNLGSLNAFDASVIKQLGMVQGATVNQTAATITGGTATPSTQAAAPTFTLPSGSATSAGNFLNEELQLGLQIINTQLLLQGSYNDQSVQGDPERQRTRTTLGFPITITVPTGFKYQGAVAEVQISVCGTGTDESHAPKLAILLPQEKTYNVASLVSKSGSVGGGATIAGVINLGGSILHGHQSYFLVQDQDTLAVQRPPNTDDCNKQSAVTFAWQFRPVLGQKVVRDGVRQTFAQISVPSPKGDYLKDDLEGNITTSWRRYDAKTGRVGDPIDKPSSIRLHIHNFTLPPAPYDVSVQDNGDGNLTVLAYGAFRTGTRVRIGGTVQDTSSPSFEQNSHYVRFVASALNLAASGASMLNGDGSEWPVLPPKEFPSKTKQGAPPPIPPVILSIRSGHADETLTTEFSGFKDALPSPPKGQIDYTCQAQDGGDCLALADVKPIEVTGLGRVLRMTFHIANTAPPGTWTFVIKSQEKAVGMGNFTVNPGPPLTLSVRSGYAGETLTTEFRGIKDAPASPPDIVCQVQDVENCPWEVEALEVTGPAHIPRLTFHISDTAPAATWTFVFKWQGNPIGTGSFTVIPVTVKPFKDGSSLVRVQLSKAMPYEPTNPDVMVIGNKAFGLRDAPFYERTPDHATALVTNDLLTTYRSVTWQRLLDPAVEKAAYPIPFFPSSVAAASDFAFGSLTPIASAAAADDSPKGGSGTPKTASPAASDVVVGIKSGAAPATITGKGLLTIGDGTPAIVGFSPPGGQRGEILQHVVITGAFTAFKKNKPDLVSNAEHVTCSPVEYPDDTHLIATITVGKDATPGPVTISAKSGADTVSGVFTVGGADGLITKAELDKASADTKIIITGDDKTSFEDRSFVRFGDLSIHATGATKLIDSHHLEVGVKIDTAASGRSDVTVVTGAKTATGTAIFTANPDNPSVLGIDPAGMKAGQTYTGVTVYTSGADFAVPPVLRFIPEAIVAKVESIAKDKLTATVIVPSTTPQRAANRYAISGAGLTSLRIVEPQVEPDFQSDTLVTFALTDDQVKQYKNLVLQYGAGQRMIQPLSPAPAPAPAARSIDAQPAAGVSASLTSIPVTGTGMSQVVSVRYNDQPLAFNLVSDKKLTVQLTIPQSGKAALSILSPPGIVLVFVYSDKTLVPYPIPVAAASK
jgi:hypothetical protein